MLGGFPTRLDPTALFVVLLFVVLVVAAKELPTRWGPIALVAGTESVRQHLCL